MKSTIETARATLWIAMGIVVLSSAMAVRGQQATPASGEAAATPATSPAISQNQQTESGKPSGAQATTGSAITPSATTSESTPRSTGAVGTAISQPNTVSKDEQKKQPDAETNPAITDVKTRQPQENTHSVPDSKQPYLHNAVEEQQFTKHSFHNTNEPAQGVEKVETVKPPDTRDFGNAPQQMTIEGRIVIDEPDGWRRTEGPGLLFYVQAKKPAIKNPLRSYDAEIYVGVAFIGQNGGDGDSVNYSSADSFIHSDISGFKSHYQRGVVKEAQAFELPLTKARHVAYTFQSHDQDNAFEEVVYIDEGDRVFALTLSAVNAKTFWSLVPAFEKFAQSYQGHIADGTRTASE